MDDLETLRDAADPNPSAASGTVRVAVRVVLLDDTSRVLLFEGRDLSDSADVERWWFATGGAVEDHETLLEAASRELREETGQTGITLVDLHHIREFDFVDHGRPRHQIEHYFAARTTQPNVDTGRWTDLERRAVLRWRWWTATELEESDVQYFPENLTELLARSARVV